jgi:hypothetical protein
MLDAGTSYHLSGVSKFAHILDRLLNAAIGVVLQGDAQSAFMGGLHIRSHERATATGKSLWLTKKAPSNHGSAPSRGTAESSRGRR